MSMYGLKKHGKGIKSNKKISKIFGADSKRRLENIVLPDDTCQNIENFNLNKNLKLKEIDDVESAEMLFPVEVNKYLRERVEALTEENGELQRSLEESVAQLKALESKCPPALHGRASDLAASKIVELSKKIRELTAELEVTKLRARNAESQQIQKKAKEAMPEEKAVVNKTDSELYNEVKDLSEKLQTANLKLCESRNQIQQLKHELKMTQKALTNEVGQNVSVQNILSGKGWRGRAQQICGLQQRLSQLTEKLANHEQKNSVSNNDSIASIRQVEKDIRAELTQELKESRKELDQMKNKWAAVKARCRVLENDLTASKNKIATLLDKTSHDDQLIATLTTQINCQTEKHKEELQNIIKKMEHNCITLENQFETEKTRNNQLQLILESREEQISELQEKLKKLLQKLEGDNIEKLQANDNATINNLNVNAHFDNDTNNLNGSQDLSGQVAEIECARLTEFIQVLNKRLEVQRMNSLQTEEELRAERQKSAKLETKVARLELERVGADRTPSTYSVNSNRSSASEPIQNEKAKEKIELLEERCAALKTRLQCVSQEKEDDFHRMTCLLDEAKKSYVEILRKNSTSSCNMSFKD